VPVQPLPPTGCETGIAVGLKVLLITADGRVVDHPRPSRTAEQRVAKAGRQVSRRKQGSHRRRKAVGHLQRAHQHVQHQRADFHHKTVLTLLPQYDAISLEDLRVATLVRNRRLAASIADAGWAQFRTLLEATAAYAGRRVMAVPPASTSQDCSGCGTRIPKSLRVRTQVCTACGLVLDRDANAARNIQGAGQARRGVVASAAALNRATPAFRRGECQCDECPPCLYFSSHASPKSGHSSRYRAISRFESVPRHSEVRLLS
jgi:putative transposase